MPFFHPRLFDMISYASQKNIGTCVSTNFLLFSEEKAKQILSKFKWGPHFLEINRIPLEEYSKAKDSEEVVKIQEEFL